MGAALVSPLNAVGVGDLGAGPGDQAGKKVDNGVDGHASPELLAISLSYRLRFHRLRQESLGREDEM